MPESEPHHHRQYTEQRCQQEQGTKSQACHWQARQAGSGRRSLHGIYPSKTLGQGHYKQLPPNRNRTDIKNTSFSKIAIQIAERDEALGARSTRPGAYGVYVTGLSTGATQEFTRAGICIVVS